MTVKSSSFYSSVGGHLNGPTNAHMVVTIEELLFGAEGKGGGGGR